MNTMKRIIVAVVMFIGLLGRVHASVFSTTFTAVAVTGSSPAAAGVNAGIGSDMELLEVEIGTGAADGTSYVSLYDTATVYNNNVNNADPAPLGDLFTNAGNARWTFNQQFSPPIPAASTSTAAGLMANGYTRVDFRDAQGNGRPIAYSLIAFKRGTDSGYTITFRTRKRRTSPEH